jgi:alanine racemase
LEYTSSDIARIVKGTLVGNPGLSVKDFVTDSRMISYSGDMAFFAIRGKNHDGHRFIRNLYDKGVRVFIVEELPSSPEGFTDSAFIVTENTISALQALAASKRKEFHSTVIAVTGSAGKTVVKEWLADIMGDAMPVIRSPKSFNSQIGVPLSVWKLEEKYSAGIFEAGISMPGEMEKLRDIIDPGIGVITNIGDAHSENFPGNEEKAAEKLKLFDNASMIIYCADQSVIARLLTSDERYHSKRLVGWSMVDEGAPVFFTIRKLEGRSANLKVTFNAKSYEFIIPFNDRASVENAMTVTAVCLALNIETGIIRKGLANLVSVAMRMEIKAGINGCQLIEDFYNSDPGSLGMALDYLKSQDHKSPVLILSDFVQSGRNETELYTEVAMLVRKAGVSKVIGIGPALSRNSSFFGPDGRFFYTTSDFISQFSGSDFRNEIILLKGARKYEFERIGSLLEQQAHQTVLEVNLDALAHNLNEFRRFLNPGTRIMAMVKAFAYGAGPAEISSFLEYHRVSYLGVAYADEGIELRNAGVTLPIMVMNPDPASSEQIIRYNLEPEIYSFRLLEKFTETASRYGMIQYPVHLKIDTGMHRLGFMMDEIDELALRIGKNESLRVISVFSHFAGSDDPALDHFTNMQAGRFMEAVEKIKAATGYPFLRHICNSAAIARFPQYQFEMVRPGIGIYGIGDYPGIDLKPVGRFKTRISQVKVIPAGEPVGYNCADVSDHERTIGILQAGYADGVSRKLGNRNGFVFIRNMKVPIVGNICMDMFMADLTGLGAEAGDEAEIFGDNISIEEMARECQTIPYEILTSIPGRVKRVFFRE